jgi:type IV pilus assembly protein PilW
VLNKDSSNWWSDWERGEGIYGYAGNDNSFSGTKEVRRVSGTAAVVVWSGTLNEGVTVTSHNSDLHYFTVKTNETAPNIDKGDILLVCDYKQAAIFQTTNVDVDSSNGTIKIEHNTDANTGASVSPGNCSKDFYYLLHCSPPPDDPRPYTFKNGGFISKLAAYAWYIGYNGRGGRSLYRLRIGKKEPEEVAEGVINLQIQYLTRDDAGNLATGYVDAGQVEDWTKVVAVRLEFTLQSLENVATGGGALQRPWNTVVTLRNRAP